MTPRCNSNENISARFLVLAASYDNVCQNIFELVVFWLSIKSLPRASVERIKEQIFHILLKRD